MNLPLILTLDINREAFDYFNSIREKHFPSSRNHLKAHLTLFHQLPQIDEIDNEIELLCNTVRPFTMNVVKVVCMGNGVAYKIESPTLEALHKKLQQKWTTYLIPQDKNKLWPHITVQNKVRPEIAQELLFELNVDFEPFHIIATGFRLWEYQGGPWRFFKAYDFDACVNTD